LALTPLDGVNQGSQPVSDIQRGGLARQDAIAQHRQDHRQVANSSARHAVIPRGRSGGGDPAVGAFGGGRLRRRGKSRGGRRGSESTRAGPPGTASECPPQP